MVEEVLGSDTLHTYLVVSNVPHGVPRISTMHSTGRYSAGFVGANAATREGARVARGKVAGQLPPMVAFLNDPQEDLGHGLTLETVLLQPDVATDAYFTGPIPLDLMDGVSVAAGGIETNFACICPTPQAWAV